MTNRDISRRRFGALAGSAFVSLAVGDACRLESEQALGVDGRLTARPRSGVTTSAERRQALGLANGRDAILQLPEKSVNGSLPLLVLFHGANGSGEGMLRRVGAAADAAGIAVLAPDSRGATWDAIRDGFGRDVMFLDRALDRAFATVSVDADHVTAGGFSDGATYALSLGLINGDLFRRVIAFSPGFIVSGELHGKPHIFVSHGTADPILPIDRCSRVIVPRLQARGYDVTFHEFEGRHEVPAALAREAMEWMKG